MEAMLTQLTAAFLIGGWLFTLLYSRRKARRGVIVRPLTSAADPLGWLQAEFVVRIDDGREVVARATGCVHCQGGLGPGRRVGLLRDRQGFVVLQTDHRRPAPANART